MRQPAYPFFPSFFHNQIALKPWWYFGLFFTANALLSYFSLPLQAKLWICLFGLFLPFVHGCFAFFRGKRPEDHGKIFSQNYLAPGILAFGLFLALLFLTRFDHLTQWRFWPFEDEAKTALMGMAQAQHWQWNWLYTEAQYEPLFIWLTGIYFRWVEPSLFSMRFLSALVSLATAFAGYWAARQYFSRFFSFLAVSLFAFSFWAFLLSRCFMHLILLPLVECLCLGCLGCYLMAVNRPHRWKCIGALTLLAGLGFYVWTNWMAVWLSLAVVLFFSAISKWRKKGGYALFFTLGSMLLALPMALTRLSSGSMAHIESLLDFSVWESTLAYLASILWSPSFPFGPNWGGLLNPFLASWALLGVLELIRLRKTTPGFGLGLGVFVFLCFLPAALTKGVEMFRLITEWPFLIVLALGGLQSLLSPFTPKKSYLVATLVLGSCFLDGYNFLARYCDPGYVPPGQAWQDVEYCNAYHALEDLSRRTGPMYVFSEFSTDYDDKALNVAVYPFDALQNPALADKHPQWSALLVNAHYSPFLLKQFPGARFQYLNNGLVPSDRRQLAGLLLIPTDSISPLTLTHWLEADQVYRKLIPAIKGRNPKDHWEPYIEYFKDLNRRFPQDAFLTAVYWEKTAFFQALDRDFLPAARSYQNAVEMGYPASHLYYDLGLCLHFCGRQKQADQAMQKAFRLEKKTD
jgi:hypothetical protein